MTELLYQTDSYLREFSASVTAANAEEHAVALDRSAFYPGGGGQPCDVGWLVAGGQNLTVTRVKRQDDAVWHWVEGTLPAAGAPVIGRLDWEHRYKLMRTHTALHILCGVVFRDYGALVTGGNMEVRTVEIVGLDLQADGNTHVANTREVGRGRIIDYQSKGRINKRIYIELDARSDQE